MLDPRSPVPHYADHNEGGVCRIHGWRCLHITMLAVFADHDDGGAQVLNQTQFKTMTLGLHNIHTYHVHTGHRVRRQPFSWRPLLCRPPNIIPHILPQCSTHYARPSAFCLPVVGTWSSQYEHRTTTVPQT